MVHALPVTSDAAQSSPESNDTSGNSHARRWTAAPLTAWAVTFVLLRIFAVSGYDWDTAFNVSTTLDVNDAASLAFGSLMGGHLLVEVLLLILLPLLIAGFCWTPGGRRPMVVLPGLVSVVVLVALTVSYRDWWLPVTTAAVFGVLVLIHALPRRFPIRRMLALTLRRVGLVSGVGVLLAAVFIDTPWVPKEHIETTTGSLDAYVLKVDSGYLNVLTDQHEFRILPSDNIIARDCDQHSGNCRL